MAKIRTMLARLPQLLAATSVVGAGVAFVQDDRIEVAAAGTRDASGGRPVTADTVFDVASLTKPLVAFAALQLVDERVLDLNQPLSEFTRLLVPDDPRSARITAYHLLTHTCGLQNVRGKEPLRMFFEPGAWFSYSSLGFMYLQLAVEAKTGEPLETTIRRLVFEPLGMVSSSLEWRDVFAKNQAAAHDAGARLAPHRPAAANASYSLKTTASDYAKFARAVLRGDRLRRDTWEQWFAPAVMVPSREIERLHAPPEMTEPDIGWALGWGVEPIPNTFFHWGKMAGMRSFVMGSRPRGTALVVLTNCNTGLRLATELVVATLPDSHAAMRWLREGVTE
jgi:CubicO group peptidase (beta-lactamase class C family)